ncbi:hypothetical protein FVE85_2963 [Porphyridium purpureum]|uniref:Uncharacterized protein n=1 Tax=Porphyridium purpureum TaxID=35688 RepID=A0A5J4YV50_PORPP|nr:hypothetical protein FVE85_2963 [Porphyridium purpureum]|eukprot:POR2204..scf227_4
MPCELSCAALAQRVSWMQWRLALALFLLALLAYRTVVTTWRWTHMGDDVSGVHVSQALWPGSAPALEQASSRATVPGGRSQNSAASRYTALFNRECESGYALNDKYDDSKHNELQSKMWAPSVINQCESEWMPPEWAPCVASTSREHQSVYGEQLLFPDFELRMPVWMRKSQKFLWLDLVRRGYAMTSRGLPVLNLQPRTHTVLYEGLDEAQNFVVRNGALPASTEPFAWCLNEEKLGAIRTHEIHSGTPSGGVGQNGASSAALMVLLTHFESSGSTRSPCLREAIPSFGHVLVQAAHLWQTHDHDDVHLALKHVRNTTREVAALLLRLGFKSEQIIEYEPSNRVASDVLMSCTGVRVHPFFIYRLRELLGFDAADSLRDQSSRATTVLYSRSHATLIENEAALLDTIRAILLTRRQGETLLELSHALHEDDTECASFEECQKMVANAKLMIGASSGNAVESTLLDYHVFAPRGAAVVELFASKDASFSTHIFESSTILEQMYFPLIYEGTLANKSASGAASEDTYRISVNVEELAEVIQFSLRQYDMGASTDRAARAEGGNEIEMKYGPAVRLHYDMPFDEQTRRIAQLNPDKRLLQLSTEDRAILSVLHL